MSIIEDAETLRSFQEESKEHLNGIESDLLAIEEAGADIDEELVNKVFRAMHSIKGGAGFLGLETVKQLSHSAENLLNMIRNRQLVPNPLVVNALLEAVDILNTMIDNPPASNEVDISSQLQLLGQITNGGATPKETVQAPPKSEEIKRIPPSEKVVPIIDLTEDKALHRNERYPAGTNIFQLEYDLEKDIHQRQKTLAGIVAELEETGIILESSVPLDAAKKAEDELMLTKPIIFIFSSILEKDLLITFLGIPESRIQQLGGDTPAARGIPTALDAPPASTDNQTALPPASLPPSSQLPPEEASTPRSKAENSPGKAATAENSLRVNVKLLDNLMTLAGELVLTRNQLLQTVSSRNQQNLDTVTQRLDMLTSELQEAIMSTRMQPVGNIFNKFKRVVRDMSRSLDKEINLIIEGGEVDLDKTIIEAIGDPLTHLVRNSVDHGIEKPMERVAKGKSSEGTLRLSAFHQGGHVIIEITDDGAGINVERVKEKALTMGAYTQAQLEAMPEKEVAKLIFMPGLSTAKEVTDVSGRGVGMDVVNANLSRIGGVFDIDSKAGLGTTISIKLPLTLAIIPSLIVSVENERYAIPQVNMIELVRIPAAQVKEKIERIGAALVMRLRGELLPLIHLTEVLDISNRTFTDPQTLDVIPEKRSRLEDRRLSAAALQLESEQLLEETAARSSVAMRSGKERRGVYSAYNILVVSAGNFHYGLIVDKLLDSEEIVVKPLGSHLRGCKGYAGATIQGDGRVALILDVVGISTLMHLSAVKQEVIDHRKLADDLRAQDKQSLLIVRNPPKDQFAIPLGLVSRIEKIKRSQLEITGGRRNIQYRGGSLPLFTVDEAAKVGPIDADAIDLFVIVFPLGGKEVGILTSEIVDVIEATLTIDDITHKQPGILGSAIILEQITLLVDLYGIVAAVMPEWTTTVKQTLASEKKGANILVVEDSKFFINQLCDFVGEAGYTPFKANDGVEALSILAEQPIDLVLTDIEMPNMDGLQLSEKIRANKSFSHLPIIAVTSVAGEAAEKRGFAAGINEYLIKLDREQIIKTIREYLGKEVLH